MYESMIALKMNCIFNNIWTTVFYVIIIVTVSTTLRSDNFDPQHLDWSQHHLLPLLGANQLLQHGARPAQHLSGEH